MSRQSKADPNIPPSPEERMTIYHCLCGTLLIVLFTFAGLIIQVWFITGQQRGYWSLKEVCVYALCKAFFLICHFRIWGKMLSSFPKTYYKCAHLFPHTVTFLLYESKKRSEVELWNILRSKFLCRIFTKEKKVSLVIPLLCTAFYTHNICLKLEPYIIV